MTIVLDDTPWLRSYSVWSQLAAEPLPLTGGTHAPSFQDAPHGDLRSDERDERSMTHEQLIGLA